MKLSILRTRERKHTIRGEENIFNDMSMACETAAETLYYVSSFVRESLEEVTIKLALFIGVAMVVTPSVWAFVEPWRTILSSMWWALQFFSGDEWEEEFLKK